MKLRIIIALITVAILVTGTYARGSMQPAGPTSVFLPLLQADDTPADKPPAIPGQYVVVWKPGAAPTTRSGDDTPEAPIIDVVDVSDLVTTRDAGVADDLIESLRDNPDVLVVEPNYIYEATYTPNDNDTKRQWAWNVTDAYDAWDVTRGSADVVIAIIDTGIDLDHPDLDDKIVPGYDFVDNDSNADDGNGHGTHVAGTAAAEANNGLGGAGFCPECKLMPIRVLDNGGSGSLASVARGVIYAADNGADVINLSLGGGGSTTMQQALDYAWNKGAFITCSAGNNSSERIYYPAGYDHCYAVASTIPNDQRSSFSNYGTWVEVAAPGSGIYSTYRGGGYGSLSGTSMAAPHVAGLAGLLASQGLSNAAIGDRLCQSADQIAGTGNLWACGRINAYRAVTSAAPNPLPPTPQPTEPPTPQPVRLTASPAPQPTTSPEPNPTPPAGDGAIVNGGFEQGSTGWEFSADANVSTEQPHSGARSAQLGGENNTIDSITQSFVVPADGFITYQWYLDGTNGMMDPMRMTITIMGSNSRFSIGHNAANGRWYERSIRLRGLAGRTVNVTFAAETDDVDPTTFYVDDVQFR